MPSIYFLTGNPHKLEEVRLVLRPYRVEVLQLDEEKLEVQSDTLAEIARTAVEALTPRQYAFFTEDAGLFINALKGFPGPYSSYVYKTIGIKGVLKLMEGIKDRGAYFESAVALYTPKHGVRVFVERVYGRISEEPRGTGGFGFDPIFIPEGFNQTFAEMTIEEKNRISHRAKAVKSMAEWLISNYFT